MCKLNELSLVVGFAGCKRWNNGNDSFDLRNAKTKALIGSVDSAWARTILASTCPFRQTVTLFGQRHASRVATAEQGASSEPLTAAKKKGATGGELSVLVWVTT